MAFAQLTCRERPRDIETCLSLSVGPFPHEAAADYEIGPDASVPLAEAISATEAAEIFVDRIAELLAKTQ